MRITARDHKTQIVIRIITLIGIMAVLTSGASAQKPANDVTTPLHALQPDYPVPYGAMSEADIKKVLDRVFNYLDAATPPQIVNKQTGETITDKSKPEMNWILKPGDFRLNSYEWGVAYSGMMLIAETSGDAKYNDYVKKRFSLLAEWVPVIKKGVDAGTLSGGYLFRQTIDPRALDD